MNWFDQYKKDFNFQKNSEISKETGINESSLRRIQSSNNWRKVNFESMSKLAKAAGKTMDELEIYLVANEAIQKLDKK